MGEKTDTLGSRKGRINIINITYNDIFMEMRFSNCSLFGTPCFLKRQSRDFTKTNLTGKISTPI